MDHTCQKRRRWSNFGITDTKEDAISKSGLIANDRYEARRLVNNPTTENALNYGEVNIQCGIINLLL